jgi:hypothetical protein
VDLWLVGVVLLRRATCTLLYRKLLLRIICRSGCAWLLLIAQQGGCVTNC